MSVLGYKIALVGASGSGKTSALDRLFNGNFRPETKSTLEARFYEKSYQVTNSTETIDLMIWDTPGREILYDFVESSITDADAVFIFYSINERSSFDEVPKWIERVRSVSPKAILVMVSNKLDLIEDSKISRSEEEKLALQNDIPLFRVSVKENYNLSSLFDYVSEAFRKIMVASMDILPHGSEIFIAGQFDTLDLVDEPYTARTDNNKCLVY